MSDRRRSIACAHCSAATEVRLNSGQAQLSDSSPKLIVFLTASRLICTTGRLSKYFLLTSSVNNFRFAAGSGAVESLIRAFHVADGKD